MTPPISRVISTSFDAFKRLVVKVNVFGKNDTRTAFSLAPFGIDSNPIPKMAALYSDTTTKKESCIVGYINIDCLSAPGETRLYAVDDDGNLKVYAWLKKDGTIELAGNNDNAVRYVPLNNGMQNLVNQLQVELGKIATGIVAGGGTYTPGTLSLDITQSKINEIKTP